MGSLLQSSQARLCHGYLRVQLGGGQGICTPKGLWKLSWHAAKSTPVGVLQPHCGRNRAGFISLGGQEGLMPPS